MRKSPNSNPLFLKTTNRLKHLGSLSCTLLLFYCSACSASMFHKSSVKPPGIFRLLTMHRGSMSTWSLNHSSGLGRGPRHQIPSKSSWSTTLCFSPTQFTFWIEMFCSFCNRILVLILFILLFAKPTQRCTPRLFASSSNSSEGPVAPATRAWSEQCTVHVDALGCKQSRQQLRRPVGQDRQAETWLENTGRTTYDTRLFCQ